MRHSPSITERTRDAVSEQPTGLTSAEVEERMQRGAVNQVPAAPTRTLRQITRANVLTPVNLIMGTLLVLILVANKPGDALFAGVIVSNSVIGIIQELRAKRALDKLAVLNAPQARIVRNGRVDEYPVDNVVADDLLVLQPGDQVVVDADVVASDGLELDESLLTGEADPIAKDPGDEVLSGSFVAAGSGHVRATKIGAESYASSLAEEARRFVLVNSELRNGINQILRWLTWVIPPVSVLLLLSLLDTESEWQNALQGTVAAAVAMVPDGLVLLTSIAFIVGVLALARRQALAKELASVELLARVDVLCLDKTGTITTGAIVFAAVEELNAAAVDIGQVLADLADADPAPNATLDAIADAFPLSPSRTPTDRVAFSSARKWASTTFDDGTTWYLGAPDVLTGDPAAAERVAAHAADGRRVIALATGAAPNEEALPSDLTAVALVLLEDQIRPDAPEILGYFAKQGITLRVISGDHPTTVSAVAARAGVPGATKYIDARDLIDDADALSDTMDDMVVFGRVTPHQKRAMVKALQARGHVVAMTGDGVNDVLALKEADMGIAMGAGSAATRSVAQLTLLDNRFSTLPTVLAEGRRVINNIERVANLFVVKATYAVLLAAATGAFAVPFPFLPRHLTLIGTFSIGVPGFFLALAPNARRARPGFVNRVLRFSLPAGFVAAVATFVVYQVLRTSDDATLAEARTAAALVLLGVGLVVLGQLARPLTATNVTLIVSMGLAYLLAMIIGPVRDYFILDAPPAWGWWVVGVATLVAGSLIVVLPRLAPWINTEDDTETSDPRGSA